MEDIAKMSKEGKKCMMINYVTSDTIDDPSHLEEVMGEMLPPSKQSEDSEDSDSNELK